MTQVMLIVSELTTAEAYVVFRLDAWGFVVDKVAMGQVFLSLSVSPSVVSFYHCSIFTHYLAAGYRAHWRPSSTETQSHIITTITTDSHSVSPIQSID
jgi:hypothetical protein